MNGREGFVRRIVPRGVLGVLTVAALAVFIGMGCGVTVGPRTAFAAEAPREIDGLRVTQIELGANHSAAITENGALWLWGSNEYGQIGDGTNNDRLSPVRVLEDVQNVSLGYSHTAAVTIGAANWETVQAKIEINPLGSWRTLAKLL